MSHVHTMTHLGNDDSCNTCSALMVNTACSIFGLYIQRSPPSSRIIPLKRSYLTHLDKITFAIFAIFTIRRICVPLHFK